MKLKGTDEFTKLKWKNAIYFIIIKKNLRNELIEMFMRVRDDNFNLCKVILEINNIIIIIKMEELNKDIIGLKILTLVSFAV